VPKLSKRDQLLEATKELLWEVGFEAMSPRDIQERSEARPGSLYHHFPSKLAIAGQALEDLAQKEVAHIDEFLSKDGPPLDTLRQYLLLKRDTSCRGCRFGRLVNETSIENNALRGPVTSVFEAIRTNLTQLLARAQGEGTLPPGLDPRTLAVSLLALMQGGAVLARTYQDEALFDQTMEGAMALLSGAARTEKTAPR
jgi:AcrR family transcriptional regulator